MAERPIEDHGVIGDLHTVALVAKDGVIDFLCFPHFDSPTVFGALLDDEKGGMFRLAPDMDPLHSRQFYVPDSVILLTHFFGEAGLAEVSDFMPVKELGHSHDLVRRAKAIRGDIPFRLELAPRFNYGRSSHRIERHKDCMVLISDGDDRTALRFRSSVPCKVENGAVTARFRLRAGQTAGFVLEQATPDGNSRSARPEYISEAFKETLNFWQDWAGRSHYRGRWREMVHRSAMTLKLLTYAPTGALVAAPTFGLPEEIGGVRNWDYRYTWIRDASFTIYALMNLGYVSEAQAYMTWVEKRCGELDPDIPLHLMYGIDGRRDLTEFNLDWKGYRGSQPVRVGNKASRQLQLDIYGELLDAVFLYNRIQPISYDLWKHLTVLVDWVCEHWREPDHGIWEVRHQTRPFLYSRVMCWVAIDRALRLASRRSFPAPAERWSRVRDEIYCDVYENFWDTKLKAFVQFQGSKAVDASALLLPIVKFVAPQDPRWQSTLKVINERLAQDALVYRYDPKLAADDGLPGTEGTFTVCSFWNIECLIMAGEVKPARLLFEKMLGYGNHLGLYAEEIGWHGEHLGNFPQALTHLGLISAAQHLDSVLEETD